MNNDGYRKYLRDIKIDNFIVLFFRLFIIVALLFVWQVLASIGVINTFLTSSPLKIVSTIRSLVLDGILLSNIITTIVEIVISCIVSFAISFIIASIMWKNNRFARIISPYINVLNALPKVALGPLIIIWAGSGEKSIILMGILISVFVTTLNLYNHFINTDYRYVYLMKTFKANDLFVFRNVVLKSNKRNILETIKLNISMNYIGVIMGELLVSKKGLGYLIMYGSSVFKIDLVITSVFILCILAYGMCYVVDLIEKKTVV